MTDAVESTAGLGLGNEGAGGIGDATETGVAVALKLNTFPTLDLFRTFLLNEVDDDLLPGNYLTEVFS